MDWLTVTKCQIVQDDPKYIGCDFWLPIYKPQKDD